MHGDLLVLLAAAWLGPALLDARRATPPGGRGWPVAAVLMLAIALAMTQRVPTVLDYAVSLAFSAMLLWLGDVLARSGRAAGARRLAVAVGGGLLAVVLHATVSRQALPASLLPVLVPVLLLVLLAPAAAAMSLRIREAEAPAALRGVVLPLAAASALALGLQAVAPALSP